MITGRVGRSPSAAVLAAETTPGSKSRRRAAARRAVNHETRPNRPAHDRTLRNRSGSGRFGGGWAGLWQLNRQRRPRSAENGPGCVSGATGGQSGLRFTLSAFEGVRLRLRPCFYRDRRDVTAEFLDELLQELWVAREMLSRHGPRPNSLQMQRTWTQYCEDARGEPRDKCPEVTSGHLTGGWHCPRILVANGPSDEKWDK